MILKYCSGFALTFIIVSSFSILLFKYYNPQQTSFMQIMSEQNLLTMDTWDGYSYNWVNIDEISSNFLLAVIASEDQKFPKHFGFDIDQISKAVDEKVKGIRFRGASTITQQTAKNMFLWGGKDYLRKAFEAYYTLLTEVIWGKKRIIEIYANVAQLGGNIYGVESASSFYFNKSASSLSKGEAAILAAILPNPAKFNPKYPSRYLLERRDKILVQMENLGGIGYLNSFMQ